MLFCSIRIWPFETINQVCVCVNNTEGLFNYENSNTLQGGIETIIKIKVSVEVDYNNGGSEEYK